MKDENLDANPAMAWIVKSISENSHYSRQMLSGLEYVPAKNGVVASSIIGENLQFHFFR